MAQDNIVRADFFRYRGRSMWPAFQEGDLLEVQPVVFAELRVGDCITYRLNDCETRITHRISDIRSGLLRTRGDASRWPDECSVSANQLVGRVTGRYRLGCLKAIPGGVKGRLLRGFYYYAGRLDPQRAARGGDAARLLRSRLQWLAASFYRRGTVREVGDNGEGFYRYWLIGQRPWARFESREKKWLVPWPQSLLIDPAKLPRNSQA
jgi:hypothetical protein